MILRQLSKRIFFIIICIFLFERLTAQTLNWKSYTNVGTIQDIAIGKGSVWSGSNGGVLQFQLANQEITTFTNTEGLSSNEVVAVEIDKHSSVWFALFNGALNRYMPDTGQWDVIEFYKGQTINDMVAFGDSLYVALDNGVSLFLIDKLEVKETYQNLGLSTGEIIEKIGANSVLIDGKDIWVATNKGIAQSSLTFTNLLATANWTQHTTQNGLQTNQINKMVVLDSILYAATKIGVERYINGHWETVGSLNRNISIIDVLEPNQFIPDKTIVIATSTGVRRLESDSWVNLLPGLSDITALKTDRDGNIWIGRKDKGLAKSSFENNTWELFETNSPASNQFNSLALDSKGRLWCASKIGGIQMLEGDKWTNFSRQTGLSNNDQRTVIVDGSDRVWAGSWGGGVTIFEESSNGFTITKIDTSDGILAGADTPAFVVVNHLTKDQNGNIWILNREANNTRVLAVRTPDEQYTYFLSTVQEIGTPFVMNVVIDRTNRAWIGTEFNGIKVIEYHQTLFDKTDDDYSQGLITSEGLLSNKINGMAEDKDGVMWIATDNGVNNWFQEKVRIQFGLLNDFVNTVGIDGRNNKWFGTANGVSVLDNDGVTWTHFTTGNSPLVSKNVLSFAFNEETGDVWIGTDNGLSLVQTPFVAAKENLSLMTGYPNPFEIIDGKNNVFTITKLAENTKVVIYTTAGSKVRSFNSIPVFWDGKDDDENYVASGIYVFLAYTDSGISAVGKVAVIRH